MFIDILVPALSFQPHRCSISLNLHTDRIFFSFCRAMDDMWPKALKEVYGIQYYDPYICEAQWIHGTDYTPQLIEKSRGCHYHCAFYNCIDHRREFRCTCSTNIRLMFVIIH